MEGLAVERRLQFAVALSILAHIVLLSVLTRLPRPVPAGLPVTLGAPFALHAMLQGELAVVPPQQPVVEPTPEPPPVLLAEPKATPKATAEPVQLRPATSFGRRQGPLVQSANSGNVTLAQGRVTSGLIKDPKALGDFTGVNLALRYPTTVSKTPTLHGSLSVIYPVEALIARVGMHIAAVVTVDADGNVAAVSASPDDPWFGPAIVAAFKDAHFSPAEIDGARVPYWIIFDFDFAIVSK